ncbi:hypothetical protein VP01_2723g2 [Puccinia sorghi]|uniref:Uncharacterized protein n=1 Tax=Puccinia sorghi TaxID=27349 RepID=A0A0L6V412_9BASI|nr:hypothetical protein VP01_2723g2 [Puccinia sorghi]
MRKPQIIKGYNCHPACVKQSAQHIANWAHLQCLARLHSKHHGTCSTFLITVMLKVRIAHLRLATVANFLDSKSRHVSQWDQIDSQLELLRQQPANYTKHWHRLVSSRDKSLFSNSPPQDKLVNGNIWCPTHEEVLAKMAGHVDVPAP